MKRLILFICGFVFAPLAVAQNSNFQTILLGPTGRPLAGATVTVCSNGATGFPCAPTVNIYSDQIGTPLGNPFTTDSLGNLSFWALPGTYTYTVTGPGITSNIYSVVLPCIVGANCVQGGMLPTQTVPFSSTPSFAVGVNASYDMTLTGNVTSMSFTGTPGNGNVLRFSFTQDNVGGRTVAFPGNVAVPASHWTLNLAPNSVSNLTLVYDGTSNTWIDWEGTGARVSTLPSNTATFATSMTFDATANASYSVILTGNVTTSTITPTAQNGNLLGFHICQDGVGSRTFSWPANALSPPTIQSGAGLCTDATFKFDGTNWSQLTQPASGGGGGGGTPGSPVNCYQKNVAGSFGAGNVCENGTTLTVGDNVNNVLGPNPATYVTAYGAVPINPNSIPKATSATCVNGNASLSYSGLSGTLLNGYGVMLPGCGGANGMSTPTITSVTPVLNAGGLNTGYVVAAPAGSTKYCYIVALRSKLWGITAGSSEVCTTTGPASLGPGTLTITSASRTNNVITYLVNSTAAVAAGALLHISGTSDDSSCGGDPIIATIVDGTHLTAITGMDSRQGGSTSCTGGTAKYDVGINIVLPQSPSNAYEYLVYGNQQGAETFLNFSLPTGLTNHGSDPGYLSVQDWGSVLEVPSTLPYWAPSTPPTQAVNNNLVTTIASGCTSACASSGTITLATAPSISPASPSTMVFDDAPTIKAADTVASSFAAGGGGYIYTPFGDESSSNYCYVTNSYLTLSSPLSLGAPICAGDTIQSNAQVRGDLAPNRLRQSAPQFAISPQIPITCATGSPCLWTTTGWVNNVTIGFPANSVGVLDTTTGTSLVHDVNFVTDQTHDCMGTLLYILGSFGASFGGRFENTSWLPGPSTATPGNCMAPALITKQNSEFSFENISMSERGFAFSAPTFGLKVYIDQKQEMQSSSEPMFTFMFQQPGTAFVQAIVNNVTPDTIGTPVIANWSGPSSAIAGNVIYQNSGLPSNNQPVFSGKPFSSILVSNVPLGVEPGNQVGQNTNVCINNGASGLYANGIFSIAASSSPTWCNTDYIQGVASSFLTDILPPAAPTVAVTSGGSITVGAHTITVQPVFYNGTTSGGNGRPSFAASFTTTTGNQSISVSNYVVTGAISYIANVDGFIANVSGCSIPQITASTFTYSGGTCGISQMNIPAAGPVTVNGGLVASQIQYVGQYADYVQGTGFGNPAAGRARIDVDSLTNFLTCTLSSGTSCMPTNSTCGVSLSIQYNNSGPCGGIPVPTTPALVPQSLISTPSVSDVGTTAVFSLPGIVPNAQTGTTYTLAATDRLKYVTTNNAASIAVTIPQAGTGAGTDNDFTHNFAFVTCDLGAGTATFTPTTSNISYVSGGTNHAAAASMPLSTGQCALVYSDNTNYFAWISGSTGISTTQTNTVNNSSQSLLNLINSAATNGVTLTVTNTSGGTVQLGITGTLNNSGLTNSSTTVNGVVCTLGSTCSTPANTLTIANAGTTGTTASTLTKQTGAPATAVIAATTDTGGIIGICTANCTTTGSATIQPGPALVNCVFDGATVAGDYVQISSTVAGNCHDTNFASYSLLSPGQVIGRAQTTNGAAGTYSILLFPAEDNIRSSNVVYSTTTASAHTTATTNSISSTTMVTPSANHIYEFSALVVQTAATAGPCSTQPSVFVNVQYKDSISGSTTSFLQPANINNQNSGTYSDSTQFTGTPGNIPAIGQYPAVLIYAASGTAVTVSTTASSGSGCTTGADYTLAPILKQIQ